MGKKRKRVNPKERSLESGEACYIRSKAFHILIYHTNFFIIHMGRRTLIREINSISQLTSKVGNCAGDLREENEISDVPRN